MRCACVMALVGGTLAAPTVAAADDAAMFVTVSGSVGLGRTADGADQFAVPFDPEGVLQARLTASWEPPPLPFKEPRGYRIAGAIIPEVTVGVIHVADRRTGDTSDNSDMFVGVGARLEARFSQRRMGLLRVSARGGAYLAGRVGFLTDAQHTRVAEVAVGEHFWLSDTLRVGGEITGQRVFGEDYLVLATARAPWRDGNGQYNVFSLTGFIGFRL